MPSHKKLCLWQGRDGDFCGAKQSKNTIGLASTPSVKWSKGGCHTGGIPLTYHVLRPGAPCPPLAPTGASGGPSPGLPRLAGVAGAFSVCSRSSAPRRVRLRPPLGSGFGPPGLRGPPGVGGAPPLGPPSCLGRWRLRSPVRSALLPPACLPPGGRPSPCPLFRAARLRPGLSPRRARLWACPPPPAAKCRPAAAWRLRPGGKRGPPSAPRPSPRPLFRAARLRPGLSSRRAWLWAGFPRSLPAGGTWSVSWRAPPPFRLRAGWFGVSPPAGGGNGEIYHLAA
jgi:hypothetical protein